MALKGSQNANQASGADSPIPQFGEPTQADKYFSNGFSRSLDVGHCEALAVKTAPSTARRSFGHAWELCQSITRIAGGLLLGGPSNENKGRGRLNQLAQVSQCSKPWRWFPRMEPKGALPKLSGVRASSAPVALRHPGDRFPKAPGEPKARLAPCPRLPSPHQSVSATRLLWVGWNKHWNLGFRLETRRGSCCLALSTGHSAP